MTAPANQASSVAIPTVWRVLVSRPRWIAVLAMLAFTALLAAATLVLLLINPDWLTGTIAVILIAATLLAVAISLPLYLAFATRAIEPSRLHALELECGGARVWTNTLGDGARTFVLASSPTGSMAPRLRWKNYLVVAPGDLSLWQRERDSLVRIVSVERRAIRGATLTQDLTPEKHEPDGVSLTVEMADGQRLQLPLLPRQVGVLAKPNFTRELRGFFDGWIRGA